MSRCLSQDFGLAKVRAVDASSAQQLQHPPQAHPAAAAARHPHPALLHNHPNHPSAFAVDHAEVGTPAYMRWVGLVGLGWVGARGGAGNMQSQEALWEV